MMIGEIKTKTTLLKDAQSNLEDAKANVEATEKSY